MSSALSKTLPLGYVFLLLILSVQPVLAQSNTQGLKWGFEVGDVFEYDCTMYDEFSMWTVVNWSEQVRVEVESLPDIPAEVYSLGGVPFSWTDFVRAYFANGTEVPGSFPWMAWPIGNWQLIATLLLDSFQSYVYENANVSLTSTLCVVEVDTSSEYDYGGNITLEFLLSTGVLSYMHYYMMFPDQSAQEEMVMDWELVMTPPSAIPVLATVGLGAAMVTTIVVIEIHRKRKTATG